MRRFLKNTISHLMLWGVIFVLILSLGFDVHISMMWELCLKGEKRLQVVFIYLLTSCCLYPIFRLLGIWLEKRKGLNVIDNIAINIIPALTMPYKGLNLKELFVLKQIYQTKRERLYSIFVHIHRALESAIWWLVLIYCVNALTGVPENDVFRIVSSFSNQNLVKRLIVIGAIIAIVTIVGLLFRNAVFKSWRNDTSSTMKKEQGATRAQKYYDRHPEKIPFGCNACGGPYPECKSSCSAFDD